MTDALITQLVEALEYIREEAEKVYFCRISDIASLAIAAAKSTAPQADERTISDQAYQVIGHLLHHCGLFESDEGQRAPDYFSAGKFDEAFLPWPRAELPATQADDLCATLVHELKSALKETRNYIYNDDCICRACGGRTKHKLSCISLQVDRLLLAATKPNGSDGWRSERGIKAAAANLQSWAKWCSDRYYEPEEYWIARVRSVFSAYAEASLAPPSQGGEG